MINQVYVIVGIITLLIGAYIYNLNQAIASLELDNANLQNKLIKEQLQGSLYKSSLDKQSLLVEQMRADYDASVDKLNKWKAKPAEVRYEVIYKTINKELKSNECKDVTSSIDTIKSIDYSLL